MLSDYPVGVVLLAKDLVMSKKFYADTLQRPILEESNEAISYACGLSRLTVTASETGSQDEQTQASWRVTDLRSELDWLRSQGVEPQNYDSEELTTVDGIADRGSVWSAWIIDPDGNALGIEQPK